MKILVPSKHGNSISVTFAKINSKSKSRQCPRPTVAAISPFPTTTTKSNKKSIGGISASSSSDPKARARNTLTLARRKLGKQLNSITIQEMHDILENRARLGLVDQISVGVYANTLESEMANSDSLSDISGETMVSSSCSGYSNSGSSGNSNSKTLTISSSKGYDGVVEELLEDMFDLCWPLDPIEKSRSTIEIRSSTPHGVVPPRFCGTSLRPLAAEQLMMKRGKIVCPLKNRLSKLNPHRAEFDSVLVERNEILGFRPQKSRLFHEIK
ncbi:hypothetical protein H4219_005568 [Mycoemilia scoparia]|uniref:Uncharacterized protein n=1 Tax=Mycoemilia scoparia TaxID=417184 RepID=A0A9W8DP18_9FUNG|nr:hypothetical protein H4219_005568 [Mycoemilia scoparia]